MKNFEMWLFGTRMRRRDYVRIGWVVGLGLLVISAAASAINALA